MRNALHAASVVVVIASSIVAVSCTGEKKTEDVGRHTIVEQVDGRPENFERGDVACYAVWHTHDEGWHLAITTAGLRRHFKGRVWMEGGGRFTVVDEWKGGGEIAAEAREGNWFHKQVHRGPADHEISFDLVEENRHLAGINFRVEGDGPLKWDLWIGGADERDPSRRLNEQVKIGRDGGYPPGIPFETFAHPDVAGRGH